MGFTSTSFIVMIQSTVSWERRGIATASNMFMRNLGNTIGAAFLGGVMNSSFQSYLNQHAGSEEPLSIDAANQLLDREERMLLPNETVQLLQEGLSAALHNVYLIVLLFAALSMVFLLFIPRGSKQTDLKKKAVYKLDDK